MHTFSELFFKFMLGLKYHVIKAVTIYDDAVGARKKIQKFELD